MVAGRQRVGDEGLEPSKKGAVHHDPILTFDTFTSL